MKAVFSIIVVVAIVILYYYSSKTHASKFFCSVYDSLINLSLCSMPQQSLTLVSLSSKNALELLQVNATCFTCTGNVFVYYCVPILPYHCSNCCTLVELVWLPTPAAKLVDV